MGGFAEILEDSGMNANFKKKRLLEIFEGNEFVKEILEDWVGEYYDKQMKGSSNFSKLLKEKELVLQNIWDEDKNEGITIEEILEWKYIMIDVVNELEKQQRLPDPK